MPVVLMTMTVIAVDDSEFESLSTPSRLPLDSLSTPSRLPLVMVTAPQASQGELFD